MERKILILLLAFVISTFISCKNSEQKPDTLISHNFISAGTQVKKASDLLGENIRYIELEEKGSNEIGRVNKIAKKEGLFFILSDDKRIISFKNDGTFHSLLNKLGKAPDEYTRIEDFEVHINDNKYQIWLADYSSIKIYEFENDWILTKTIKLPFVVNKFKKINSNQILLLTGQNDKSLTVIDSLGKIRNTYLNKQIPFLTMKPVQFINLDSMIVFPLGMSNEMAAYKPITNKFSNSKYVNSDAFLTKDELITLFKKYDYGFFSELKKYSYINNLRVIKDKIFIQYYLNGEKYLTSIDKQGNIYKASLFPKSKIMDDISPRKNINYLTNFLFSDSDDSIIFLQEPENINDKIALIEAL